MSYNTTDPRHQLSEEFFQNIFSQAGDGIFLIDEQGVMMEMNPRGCEILGYSREELMGQPVLKFQPVDELPHIQQKLIQLSVDRIVTTESVFIRKDGVRVPVEITGKLMSNNQIIGMLRDISERRLAVQALIDSEMKFRSLVEQSPDGIFVVNEGGYIIEWNGGMENISGLKRSVALGEMIWNVHYTLLPEELHTDSMLERLQNKFNEILETGQGPELCAPYETIFQLTAGNFHNVEVVMYTYKTNIGYRIGGIVRDITQRKQAERRLEYLAMHDVLTDLPNRQFFQDRLEVALKRAQHRSTGALAIMLLDIDNFKEVNDRYGHACGDQLLKIVALRLQTSLRKSDTAARMGGDEFTLIIEDAVDCESCTAIAQKVLDTLSQPMEIEGRHLRVTASIGISLLSPENDDATTLLRKADIAMYQAKRTHNCYKFYTNPIAEKISTNRLSSY
ncbi:MAG: diguanylate cyclase [Anaerolineales bacterium]